MPNQMMTSGISARCGTVAQHLERRLVEQPRCGRQHPVQETEPEADPTADREAEGGTPGADLDMMEKLA